MVISSLILSQDHADIPDRCVSMIIAVHDDNGTDGATAQAGHGLQGELLIFGGLTGFDFQPPFKFIEDPGASPNMAGGALTNRADMLSPGSQAESAVERGYGHHICKRDIQRFGDESQALLREVPILALDILEDGNQALLLTLVLIDKGLDFFSFKGHYHFSGW